MELSASDSCSRFSSFSLFLDASSSSTFTRFPACSFHLAKPCDRHFARPSSHRGVTLSTHSQKFFAPSLNFSLAREAKVSAQRQKKVPQVVYPASDVKPSNVPSPSRAPEDGDDDSLTDSREDPDEQTFSTTEDDTSVSSRGRVEGDGGVLVEANEMSDSVDASLVKIKKNLAEAKSPKPNGLAPVRDFLEGVLEETRLIEWPSLGNVFRTTGVVLTIIFLSSAVVLTVNAILAELSDKIFNNPSI